MIRLLIADDETWILDRLATTIDWASIGVQVAGTARDGEEALEQCRALRPDIVLTDIRMPCITGLELIRRLKQEKMDCKVIIISGYDDFEYAQQAVRLGAADYILKPVDDDALLRSVSSAMETIELERRRSEALASLQKQLDTALPQLRERFLRNLLSGYVPSREWAKEEIEYFHLENQNCQHICFAIQMDPLSPNESLGTAHLLQFGLCNMAQDFIARLGSGEVLIHQRYQIVCTVSSHQDRETFCRQVFAISHGIRNMARKVLGLTVTVGIGNPCDDLADIGDSYRQALEALLDRFYFGEGGIYVYEGGRPRENPVDCSLYHLDVMCTSLRAGNRQGALDALSSLLDQVECEHEILRPVDLRSLYINVVFAALRAVAEYRQDEERVRGLNIDFFRRLDQMTSMDELRQTLIQLIEDLAHGVQQAQNGSKRRVVEVALQYIRDHYSEPISLSDVAEAVYMNPSYFCKIFKKLQHKFISFVRSHVLQNKI